MKPHPFVEKLAACRLTHCFNPYSDVCPTHDRSDAAERRAAALSAILVAAQEREVDAIWLGRDLGYRGGRRTGLALTDDVHVPSHTGRWGFRAARPTVGESVKERTASVIWNMLDGIADRVFLWNVFPFHPHDPDNPFSNRAHNARERAVGEEILREIIGLLSPARIVAIGNDAARACNRVSEGVPVHQVRHPSYGGQTDFIHQIRALYQGSPERLSAQYSML